MRRNFRVSFDVCGGDSSLEDHLHSVAEAFFADRTVDDIAIGANIESGNVEFDASADASTAREAMETVALAVLRSIHAAGGQVIDSFTVVALDPEPFDEPLPGLEVHLVEQWRQRSVELINA